MGIIKGPDFPTGGIIMGEEGIREAYQTGKGRIYLRSKTAIEDMSGGTSTDCHYRNSLSSRQITTSYCDGEYSD